MSKLTIKKALIIQFIHTNTMKGNLTFYNHTMQASLFILSISGAMIHLDPLKYILHTYKLPSTRLDSGNFVLIKDRHGL